VPIEEEEEEEEEEDYVLKVIYFIRFLQPKLCVYYLYFTMGPFQTSYSSLVTLIIK
jgi:hypothetical protein